MAGPKIVCVDIETSPLSLAGWGLRDQSFGLNQIRETSRVLCFAAKWYDRRRVLFYSEWDHGREAMLQKAWDLFDEADIIVAHNARFDIKNLNREFLLAGWSPPSPSHTMDTLAVARREFFFASNKLDHLARQLGLGGKISHEGHGLWESVLAGHKASQRLMRDYNKADVELCEGVYRTLREQGWIKTHPHVGLWTGERGSCPQCGGIRLQSRGVTKTKTGEFQRFCCQDCGGWCRSARATSPHTTTRSM